MTGSARSTTGCEHAVGRGNPEIRSLLAILKAIDLRLAVQRRNDILPFGKNLRALPFDDMWRK